ncbi:hypothetical protein BDV96DRAFT_691276 [Lophiotrema nucula]|uniref:DUF1330 domain-containing protein n=1 Tax=Lophiotrema nucula TaxID=690887 RepID=A0A6A5YU98_9PLEO|nr:hypothetical protein BDV96DRAFT_691276 [Lophiotrema nucula]
MAWAINYEKLAEVTKTYDLTKPIYMLNMWKYRETAQYLPEHTSFAGEPCTGQEAALRYRTTLAPLLPEGASIFMRSNALTELVAPKDESWDDVFVIRYETLEGFKKMVESEEYIGKALPHRLAAFEDCRLIMLDKLD